MKISLKQKLIFIPLFTALIVYLVSFTYIVYRLQNKNKADAEKIVKDKGRQYANKLETILNSHMAMVKGIRNSFENLANFEPQEKIDFISKTLLTTLYEDTTYMGVWASNQLSHFDRKWGDKPGRISLSYLWDDEEMQYHVDSLDIGGIKKHTGYHKVMKNKKEAIMEPYLDIQLDILVTTLAAPILNEDDEFMGLAGVDVSFKEFTEILSGFNLYDGYSFFISNEGRYIYHPDSEVIGNTFAETNPKEDSLYSITQKIKNGENFNFYATHSEKENDIYVMFLPVRVSGTDTPWSVGVIVNMSEVLKETKIITRNTIIVGVIGFIIIFLVLLLVTNSILVNLKRNIEFAEKISKGDLTARIEVKSSDEIGVLAKSLMKMAERLRNIVTDLKDSSDSIDSFRAKLSDNVLNFLDMAEKQRQTSNEVIISVTDIAHHIKKSANNAESTKSISANATNKLIDGNTKVNDTNKSISTIAKTVKIIDEIADKTDLLAINAGIEAKKAGTSGKSFSVVAREVRGLAEKTVEASNRITELSKISVKISGESGDIINSLVPEMQKVNQLVEEIALLSVEQNDSIDKIKYAIEELNQMTNQNAVFSEELSQETEVFKEMLNKLNEITNFFKIKE